MPKIKFILIFVTLVLIHQVTWALTQYTAITPDGSNPGGNEYSGYYSTLSTWEAAENADLTGVTNLHRCEIIGDWSGTTDVASLTLLGWTTDATHRIEIIAPKAADMYCGAAVTDTARHNGIFSDDYYVHQQTNVAFGIYHREEHITIDGIQIRRVATAANIVHGIYHDPGADSINYVNNCIFKVDNTSSANVMAIYINDTRGGVTLVNSNIYGGWKVGFFAPARLYAAVINCLVKDSTTDNFASVDRAINCISYNSADDFDTVITIAYCTSDDGDGINGVSTPDWAKTFTDPANGDFSLLSGNTIFEAGIGPDNADLLADDVPTDDIIGTARSGVSAAIGAYEVADAPTAEPVFIEPKIIINITWVFDEVLTAAEIKRIYNADRNRFNR